MTWQPDPEPTPIKHTTSMRTAGGYATMTWQPVCSVCGWEGDKTTDYAAAQAVATYHSGLPPLMPATRAEIDSAAQMADARGRDHLRMRRVWQGLAEAADRRADALDRLERALRNSRD